MFPIPFDRKLSLTQIADYWSRETHPTATIEETLRELIIAWWRGQLVGRNLWSRIDVLRGLFRNSKGYIIFTAPGVDPPELGTDELRLVDWVIEVSLPNFEPNSWDDVNCAHAFEALADQWPWLEDKSLEGLICATKLDRAEFFGWLAKRGNWIPTFWGDASPGTQTTTATPGRLVTAQADQTANGHGGERNPESAAHLSVRNPLRQALRPAIDAAIDAVNDTAVRENKKIPNVKELREPVQRLLADKGLAASGNQIQKVAEDRRHAQRRRKPGVTIKSERRTTRE